MIDKIENKLFEIHERARQGVQELRRYSKPYKLLHDVSLGGTLVSCFAWAAAFSGYVYGQIDAPVFAASNIAAWAFGGTLMATRAYGHYTGWKYKKEDEKYIAFDVDRFIADRGGWESVLRVK
jgi:hypothetical protein